MKLNISKSDPILLILMVLFVVFILKASFFSVVDVTDCRYVSTAGNKIAYSPDIIQPISQVWGGGSLNREENALDTVR